MSAMPVFLVLNDDRLLVRADAIVAVTELDERDIDPRTGKLALGIPEDTVAVVHTAHATFYVKTPYDEIVKTVLAVTLEEARHG